MPGYIRYVDDFQVFSDSKEALAGLLDEVRLQLDSLRLTLHERKTRIYPVGEGIPFLGFRVFPHGRRLLARSVKRARRRLQRLANAAQSGKIGMKSVSRSVAAWIAHASHGDTLGLRRCLLGSTAFRAGGRPCASGRLLEQQW
ncbi:MAG: RNA-directed DNA polymerase [Bryobacteraceae bacterium]|nr:RNA-directed DNA polymerase [Bryobacteraceae bacterium]